MNWPQHPPQLKRLLPTFELCDHSHKNANRRIVMEQTSIRVTKVEQNWL